MNRNKLILTSTVGMSREQWLAFRSPVHHVKKFVIEQLFGSLEDPSSFFVKSLENYNLVCKVFRSQEWKDFVFPTIGASEISSLMGLNPWKSSIELFYEKCGVKQSFDQTNEFMFWGKEHEEMLAENWQYWEGSPESMIANKEAGNIIRRCRKVNAYIQNKDFPYLFVSLDRLINKGSNQAEECLELKLIRWFAAQLWENGIPPMYIVQLQQQLLVTDLKRGELGVLQDGMQFSVYPFDRHYKLCDRIKEQSYKFYKNIKIAVSHFVASLVCPNEDRIKLHFAEIDKVSPEPDGSRSYENFLNEKYKDNQGEIIGGEIELKLARHYKYFDQQGKKQQELKRECGNKLKAILKEANKIDLGKNGSITWRQTSRNTRTLRVNVKIDESFKPDLIPSIKKQEKPPKKIRKKPLKKKKKLAKKKK